jgi:glutaconate CoA-transferase subunit B
VSLSTTAIKPDSNQQNTPSSYTMQELMICAASRELVDSEVVFVGIGLPNVACNLAKRTHAPNLTMIYESGAIGTFPERLPLSIGDPALVTSSLSICSLNDVFNLYLQGGRIDVGFLGGAQVDRFGNINSTIIGEDYHHPKVRLPGSGGACEIAAHAKRLMIVLPQTKRSFPEKVDFMTSPGFLEGSGAREKAGLKGQGPQVVITDKGLYRPCPETQELMLVALHPDVTLEEVQETLGWTVKTSETITETQPPTSDELMVLREHLGFGKKSKGQKNGGEC